MHHAHAGVLACACADVDGCRGSELASILTHVCAQIYAHVDMHVYTPWSIRQHQVALGQVYPAADVCSQSNEQLGVSRLV